MCTSPRTASYNLDGSINFSKKKHNRELVPFQLPCGKCAECLLERSRSWSVRCIHESRLHAANAFITLTYAPEHLPSDGKLRYLDFQLFMKRLRKHTGTELGFFMCGEYGEQTHRPHYHACLFGYDFPDKIPERENKHGDLCWSSKTLNEIWGLGRTEIGSVTQKSAAYVARYILKGNKDEHTKAFQKMSTRPAIGKRFIEKWWKDVFVAAQGSIILSDGSKSKVPRYYEKWLKTNQPEIWLHYVTQTKPQNTARLQEKAEREHAIFIKERDERGLDAFSYRSPLARKRDVLKEKLLDFKRRYL